ncbi:hypothetical protein V1522DRAFT_399213 [Lipomyces starkeyi]
MSAVIGEEESSSHSRPTSATIAVTPADHPRPASVEVQHSSDQHVKRRKKSRTARPSARTSNSMIADIGVSVAASAPTDREQQLYQTALDFLVKNEPEQYLEVKLSFESYEALEEQARNMYGEKKYPYVDYCETTSTVTIYTIPTYLHGHISAVLQNELCYAVREVLQCHGRQQLAANVMPSGESTERTKWGQHRVSKTPDGGIVYEIEEDSTLTVVIETGVSETYEKLKEDVTVWLEGTECRTCILVCLTETPKYRSPKPGAIQFSDSDFRMSVGTFSRASRHGPFGPYVHKGHTWFHVLESAFAEVYKRDDFSGKISSQKYQLVRDGNYVIGEDEVDLDLIVGDFIPTDESAVADIRLIPVQLSGRVISKVLRAGIARSAFQRFSRLS